MAVRDQWTANRRALRRLQRRASRVLYRHTQASATAREGCEYVLPYAASWLRYVDQGILAVQHLHDAGLGSHAAPIRRSLIEHGICMAAIASEPESFEPFIRGLQRSTSKLKEAMGRVGVADERMDAVLAWETSEDTLKHDRKMAFKHRCEDLGATGANYYASWLEETMVSHAGYATAVLYLADPPGGGDTPTLRLEPQFSADDWGADAANIDVFLLALDAYSTMLLGDPLRKSLTRLNRRRMALFAKASALAG